LQLFADRNLAADFVNKKVCWFSRQWRECFPLVSNPPFGLGFQGINVYCEKIPLRVGLPIDDLARCLWATCRAQPRNRVKVAD